MKIQTAVEVLKLVQDGYNTYSKILEKTQKDCMITHHFKNAKKLGLIEQTKEGTRKQYRLTEKGRKFLDLMNTE